LLTKVVAKIAVDKAAAASAEFEPAGGTSDDSIIASRAVEKIWT
jgi:hypothetical protein